MEENYYYNQYLKMTKEELADKLIESYNIYQKKNKDIIIVAALVMAMTIFIGLVAFVYNVGLMHGLSLNTIF